MVMHVEQARNSMKNTSEYRARGDMYILPYVSNGCREGRGVLLCEMRLLPFEMNRRARMRCCKYFVHTYALNQLTCGARLRKSRIMVLKGTSDLTLSSHSCVGRNLRRPRTTQPDQECSNSVKKKSTTLKRVCHSYQRCRTHAHTTRWLGAP